MAHLKIAIPEDYEDAVAVHGSVARVWLDGVDISDFLTRVELDVKADGAIEAQLTVFLSGVDVELPSALRFAMQKNLPEPQSVLGGAKRL